MYDNRICCEVYLAPGLKVLTWGASTTVEAVEALQRVSGLLVSFRKRSPNGQSPSVRFIFRLVSTLRIQDTESHFYSASHALCPLSFVISHGRQTKDRADQPESWVRALSCGVWYLVWRNSSVSPVMPGHAAPLASKTLNPERVALLFIAETQEVCGELNPSLPVLSSELPVPVQGLSRHRASLQKCIKMQKCEKNWLACTSAALVCSVRYTLPRRTRSGNN